MTHRLSDYHLWGFKRIWLVDPWTYKLFVYDSSGLHEVESFELLEFGATIYKCSNGRPWQAISLPHRRGDEGSACTKYSVVKDRHTT